MADSNVATLETLTSTLIDSVNGYRDAAADAEGHQFQQLFREMADERSQIAEDLRSEIRRLGGNPPDDGSFLGKTHQRFMDLKAAITGRDDKAIINEVERGEDYLKDKFETALNSDSDPQVRSVIEHAYQSVRRGHDRVRDIKHGLEV
ncbi:ferritin-like domain-containing protein [Sphingomonas arenae]|uniref:ferritin-like domain-containing protein n=1 Tax=Sphingomonas arenae TaxID=2812555 RepID=UPI00196883A0|nr:PA2169 family four-helix-bundle protein [Sphingomonas arenae]